MPRQLVLDLPVRAATGRSDFFVSPSNALAVAQIDAWRDWPQRKLLLIGPGASGKTHLCHVWAAAAGAVVVPADSLTTDAIPALAAHGAVAVEDADRIAGDPAAETALFHLHNLTLAEGGALMMTARALPNAWPLGLPDLASRVQATPIATLQPPDDALLAAVLVKLFTDRQLQVQPKLVQYLLKRMDRSFAAAQSIVADLDRVSLASGRKISEKLASEILSSDDISKDGSAV
ncbi:HdaA/DnaA family protein [Actibacterium ureilyticum]|uniref:HdaA/DnaA family protein n=1 Tax=Actibacterium ureilyticum TaxID=1590614 RepID=UPI000BAAFACD|nr:chromosomal replication initiator DnaA [Actibacterium ureilyticum]